MAIVGAGPAGLPLRRIARARDADFVLTGHRSKNRSQSIAAHPPGREIPEDVRGFRYRSRVAQLHYSTGSRSAQQSVAEQNTGLAIS